MENYPQMICNKEITDFFNIRSLHVGKKTSLKNIDPEKKKRLNILVDNYVSQTHSGEKDSAYNLKGKLRYKITQTTSQNTSHMYGHFEVWCEKEQYRMMYENATSTNMGIENDMLRREIAELKSQLNRYKNIEDLSVEDKSPKIPLSNINDVHLEKEKVSKDLSVEDKSPQNPPKKKNTEEITPSISNNLSVEDKSPQNPPKNYEYKRIDWIDLLDHCETIDERERIFIDTLRSIGDEVFENYKESIQSSFDICPILEKHYDYLIESWEQCPEKYDIDDKITDNLYQIVNSSFDALISSED